MSWKVLLLVAAVLVALMLLGAGWSLGKSARIPTRPPSPEDLPDWVRDLASSLDDSRPLRMDELKGCPLDERQLEIEDDHPRAECTVAESEDSARRIVLVVERGRLEITTQIAGAEVNVTLPNADVEEQPERGELRFGADSASLHLHCVDRPCRLQFVEPEPKD